MQAWDLVGRKLLIDFLEFPRCVMVWLKDFQYLYMFLLLLSHVSTCVLMVFICYCAFSKLGLHDQANRPTHRCSEKGAPRFGRPGTAASAATAPPGGGKSLAQVAAPFALYRRLGARGCWQLSSSASSALRLAGPSGS